MRRVALRISGRVQGVGYRAWAEAQGSTLGLTGWVQNGEDGDVIAEVQGEDARILEFVKICRQGPRFARVEDVDVKDCPLQQNELGFVIKR